MARRRDLVVLAISFALGLAGCVGSTPGASPAPRAGFVTLPDLTGAAAAEGNRLWIAAYGTGRLYRVSGAHQLDVLAIPIGNPHLLQPACEPGTVHDAPMGSFLPRRCDLPSGVAVGAGSVWIGRNDRQAVLRLDPASGRITATIPVGFHIFNLAADATSVWAVSFEDNMVARIDTTTNAVTLRESLLHAPSGVLINDGSVWISRSGNATVVRLDAITGAEEAEIAVGRRPLPLAAGGGSIWVRCEQDSTVSRIDASTNRVLATIAVDPFYGLDGVDSMVADAGGVWISGLRLQWIEATSNQVSRSLPQSGRPYRAGTGEVWVLGLGGHIARVAA
jgi:DNA-binding beta-propeller fold protein YncE